ncbi:MAG: glycosyltransferase [Thiobacillus sp.]|nr:glycosyltransferase [Thiobacillus sp.]
MHRSGTSVITRALQVMGVQLGDRLLPTMAEVNAKGFWEDFDLNALNVEMLAALGSDWFHVAPIEAKNVETLRNEGYFLRAVELLRQKVCDGAVFGFKDPRVAKLLPFWKEVFSHCKFNVNYVLAIRNPLSVVKSLAKRDGLAEEQSYLLWLGHVIAGLVGSTGDKRVLVDYDRLLKSPDCELTRIANRMDLNINLAELQIYRIEFLDQGLRHTVYELNDLLLDGACPPIVREVYDALLDVASDEVTLDDQELQSKVLRWSDEFERIKSPLMLVDRLFTQKRIATQAVVERDGQIASLSQTVAEGHGQIAILNEALAARERRRSDQLASMVTTLVQETSQRAEAIADLTQAVAEREGQIASLNQAVAARDGLIASVNQAVAERDVYIRTLVGSKSWFITKPVRWAGRIMRGDFVAAMDPIKKALPLRNSAELSSQAPADQKSTEACGAFVIPSPINPTHPVAVILPVYRGIEMTKSCILAAMRGILSVPDSRLIAINDASPETGMQEMLEQLATQWPNVFVVLKNESNLGFVGTVNRGFAYFPQHDAVLLNSDVIVPQDWLSRLIDEAYSRADIGTVTPFSNNATICSFPHFLQENTLPFSLDVDSVDAVFRHAKLPCVEAPTGVGFCMYIRRACLEVTGYLNQEKFGRGYGEENDLCQRALKSGWYNILSPNLYAYHEGGVSFSSDKQALVDRATRVIDELHPGYHVSVQRFIAQDPLKLARVKRHIQFLAVTAVPKILHISHAIGGGVGQHIEELAHYFSKQAAHIFLAPHGEDGAVSISLGVGGRADKLIFHVPREYGAMVDLLKSAGISAVHIHHTTGLDSKILDLPHDLGVTYLLTVHDYYWLNGNPTLTDENGQYPGFYSDVQRNPLYPLPQGLTPKSWQAKFRPFIEGASCVIFPSNSTKKIFDHVYDTANAVVAPHIEEQLTVSREPALFTEKEIYTIGVLGAIGREKGADLLERVAACAKNINSPLEFKLIGYAYRSLKEVETTGPYQPQDLKGLIQKHGIDIVFFPAQCPETYSYTLSHALDSKLPIIAPNIGAFPERLSGRANTLIFNHLTPACELLSQINVFIEAMLAGMSMTSPVFEGGKSKPDFYDTDYLPIVSRSLKIVDKDKLLMPQLDISHIISGSKNNSSICRNFLTRALWSLYMNPAMRWVNYVIPYTVRRFIKRSLSRRPIHDIINLK